MNWTTLYITGRSNFREEVRKKLEAGEIDVMPGYTESLSGGKAFELYWVPENLPLRKVKEAIGSKLLFRYRLRFFRHLGEISAETKGTAAEFTPEEHSLMESMRKAG